MSSSTTHKSQENDLVMINAYYKVYNSGTIGQGLQGPQVQEPHFQHVDMPANPEAH
jgi:hypothetical protein